MILTWECEQNIHLSSGSLMTSPAAPSQCNTLDLTLRAAVEI
jgi:hypothetical protein